MTLTSSDFTPLGALPLKLASFTENLIHDGNAAPLIKVAESLSCSLPWLCTKVSAGKWKTKAWLACTVCVAYSRTCTKLPPVLTACSCTCAGPATGVATVTWGGDYSGAAAGVYTLGFDGQGGVRVEWDFTWTSHSPISPRQMGVVFGVSGGSVGGNLSWARRTPPWVGGNYPPTHIGRPVGVGVAPLAGPSLPLNASREGIPWSAEPSPIGCPDYRSTRHNVTAFVLGSGQAGLSLVSPNGTLHGRVWWGGGEQGGAAFLLAAVHSNEGGNPFSRERVLPQPTYTTGDAVAGVIQLQLGSVL